jgi:hypothetical protein
MNLTHVQAIEMYLNLFLKVSELLERSLDHQAMTGI